MPLTLCPLTLGPTFVNNDYVTAESTYSTVHAPHKVPFVMATFYSERRYTPLLKMSRGLRSGFSLHGSEAVP